MSDQGDRGRRGGLTLNDGAAVADVDFKRRRWHERGVDVVERSLLGGIAAGGVSPREDEAIRHAADAEPVQLPAQAPEEAVGDPPSASARTYSFERPDLVLLERAPGRLAGVRDALRQGSVPGAQLRRVGAGAAVAAPLALIGVLLAAHLSAGSGQAVRAARHVPAAPLVAGASATSSHGPRPVRVHGASSKRRAVVVRHRRPPSSIVTSSVPQAPYAPPASAPYTPSATAPSSASVPQYTAPSPPAVPPAPYQAPTPAPTTSAPSRAPLPKQVQSHHPRIFGAGGVLGPGHSPNG